MGITVGLGGARHNGCVAVASGNDVLGVCPQERITRVPGAGFNPSGLPDEALAMLLEHTGRHREDIALVAGCDPIPEGAWRAVEVEHHFAHACSAFLPSAESEALIVVCDDEAPQVSVWAGRGGSVERLDVPWDGIGPAALYSACASAMGFASAGREQRMEALARLRAGRRDLEFQTMFRLADDRIEQSQGWRQAVDQSVRGADRETAALMAQHLQRNISDVVLDFLCALRRRYPDYRTLCVGGALFFNSAINVRVKLEAGFDRVFVPINPGNAGLAVGTALYAAGPVRTQVSPFCGPAFASDLVKATLDNCKLTYEWLSARERVRVTVDALLRGWTVAWFEGGMEWGARALGARSILASPFAPYVLDNLNRYLKQRESWRGYALCTTAAVVAEHFDGPVASPYMECDYLPKDAERFQRILPGPEAAVRVQTVTGDAPRTFGNLLEQFGQASGLPVLVNTSFNAFREPIACTPRDAIRIFYGTGVDLLVLDEFIVRK